MSTPSLAAALAVPREGRTRGILLMLLGIALWALSDALGKWLVAGYSVSEILLVRSIAALAVLAPFIRREGLSGFRAAPRPRLQLFRAVLSTLEVVCFYRAVAGLPLADAMTFYLAGPIYVTAASALFLGERVGWRRWSAVAVGFAGVLIALNPSVQTLSGASLIALIGSWCFALLLILTRMLRGTDDTVLVTTPLVAALLAGAVSAPFAWVTPPLTDLGLLALVGVISMIGFLCVNRALRMADASVVTPYQYTLIVWAMLFGLAVFGDVPRPRTMLGAAIIVGAGLFIFMREQRRRGA